jgi:hypothetical protein
LGVVRVDLYEDEVGGLYIHSQDDSHAFAHVEREMSWLLEDLEFLEEFIASRSWYGPPVREEWTLFEALATWDDPGVWTNFERVPIDQVIHNAALVASWIPDDERTEVYDASRAGSLPPGPNAQIMLRKHLVQ